MTKPATEIASPLTMDGRGSSQSGMRLYNQRLVLSLIRKNGSLPKAGIARLTGLSAQTVSIIVRQLEGDGLLRRGDPQRGKVGQPLVPFSLNPDGAYSIGLKVGRRSIEMTLMDLTGRTRANVHNAYRFPVTSEILVFVKQGLAELVDNLDRKQRKRISGVGIAAPFQMWNWGEEVGAPRNILEAWRDFDLRKEVAALCNWPVHFCNDATAACAAELFFGRGREYRDFAYFFVGFFVGGGIALNGALYQGNTGSAGAMGPIPVPSLRGTEQLIRNASLYILERALEAEGQDPLWLTKSPADWSSVGPALDRWISETAQSLAYAAIACASVVDFEAVVIDGAMPTAVRARLVSATRDAFSKLDHRGLAPLAIVEGIVGRDARPMGAALLTIIAEFTIDRDVLLKDTG